ncbi:MAG: sigma-70 family RNA polymerase sigma factor [Saccharospirillaceae bacterium]|nr:sigma-70 family RNA polymerase sigma factor [Pseudomonadales bacterium]NRB79744.1 sigma-70 family RNA polymerase sigma factor [Saccharospirillaceae bacterium]
MLSYKEQHEICSTIAKVIYIKIRNASVDYSDLVQSGFVGLLICEKKYDYKKNIPFQWYAGKRVRGEILNLLVKYSEELALYNKHLSNERNNSITPNDSRIDLKQAANTVVDLAFSYILDEIIEPEDDDKLYNEIDSVIDLSKLYTNIELLSGNAKQVLQGIYLHGKSFTELGESLGLSKGRISQIHKEAIKNLRLISDIKF